MTKIRIQAKGLDRCMTATLGPGSALLIGREPDEKKLDWRHLYPQPSTCPGMNLCLDPGRYQLTTMTVPSARTSANHILALHDGRTLALFELGSRNGSWIKLDQQHPIMVAGALEVSLNLAGMQGSENRPKRPAGAEWNRPEDFGPAVVRALSAWFAQQDAAVECRVGAMDDSPNAMPLADGRAVILGVLNTLPFSIGEMLEVVSQYIHEQNARYMQLERRVSGMVAGSAALRHILFRLADAAASSRRTILLGPSGVGKELLARSYHGYSPRYSGPFVTVNCALLEKDLLHAQLFGARRGSFTGAVTDVVGLVEVADGGTLFLDELGELSTDVQKALLRFLDSRGEYYRLGDARPRLADVQIVCASNVDLDEPSFRKARFRDDLWYRIAATVIRIPPLCERPDDTMALLCSRTVPGTNLRVAECLTQEALTAVLREPWPGNFRDLENFIARLPTDLSSHSIDLATCLRILKGDRADNEPPAPVRGAHASAPDTEATTAAVPSTAAPMPASPPISPLPRAGATELVKAVAIDSSSSAQANVTAHPALSRLRSDAPADSNAALGWERIALDAVHAFLADHGQARVGWDQLHLLIERYLKPVFVAQAASSRQAARTDRAINYSALARRLHIGDGGTVKTHLARFEERFASMPLSIPGQARRSCVESSGQPP